MLHITESPINRIGPQYIRIVMYNFAPELMFQIMLTLFQDTNAHLLISLLLYIYRWAVVQTCSCTTIYTKFDICIGSLGNVCYTYSIWSTPCYLYISYCTRLGLCFECCHSICIRSALWSVLLKAEFSEIILPTLCRMSGGNTISCLAYYRSCRPRVEVFSVAVQTCIDIKWNSIRRLIQWK